MGNVRDRLEANNAAVIAAYTAGASLDSLAAEYDCSHTPLRAFLTSHGVSLRPNVRPKKLQAVADEVEALYREGVSTFELAAKFGVDRNTITCLLRSRNATRRVPLVKRTFHIETAGDKGMLAGLFLGEGSVILRGKGVSIRIVNQDEGIIEWLAQWGGKVYWAKPRPPRVPKSLGCWDLSGSVDVFHCLLAIMPFLVGVKRQRAENALAVLKQGYGFQEIQATGAHPK